MNEDWWFIFAPGPSFLRVDAEKLQWGKTIAVNNAVFYCPWADYLYACDEKWWRVYESKVKFFKGRRFSYQRSVGVERFYRPAHFPTLGGNSGVQAIQLAYSEGGRNIAILGFDHQHTDGKKHCHKDHPKPLGNAGSVERWPEAMDRTYAVLKRKGVTLINLSRETAIESVPRMTVEDFVEQYRNS